MSRGTKMLIGLLSFLPILMGALIIFLILNLIPTFIEWDSFEPDPIEIFITMRPVFLVGIAAAVLSIGLLVFMIMHMVRKKNIDSTERIIWVLVLLFAGAISYPIYWYMRIWKDESI